MSFASRSRGQIIQHTDVNQYGEYLGGTTAQIVNRFGTSTSLYADSITQTDTTNGLIFRAGYGASGSQTWMLDITKNRVVIKNGRLYSQGPHRYDVEAYANASDLNTDGTFKIDASCAYAINAAADAMRAAVVTSVSGSSAAWPRNRVLAFNSPVYKLASPANLTAMESCYIVSACGVSNFYSSNDWTNAGAWDSGVSGSGTTVAATNCPMFDLTGSPGTVVEGINLSVATIAGVAFGTVPDVGARPAACWLIASSEVYSGGWAGTGGAPSSNNMTFRRCSAGGWYTLAGFAFINSVIHDFYGCGVQVSNESVATRGFYCGTTTLKHGQAEPDATGELDSPFYPNPAAPVNGDERMNRVDGGAGSAAGALTFHHSEFHDMTRNGSGVGQGALSATMLFYKNLQVAFRSCIISSSSNAGVEFQGYARGVSFDQTDFYNDSLIASTEPNYFIYNNGCTIANDGIYGLDVRNTLLNVGPVVAMIGGTDDANFRDLVVQNNRMNGPAVLSTSGGVGAATVENLRGDSYIECDGTNVVVKGSIASSVTLVEPSTITFTAGGYDRSEKRNADGSVHYGAPAAYHAFGTIPAQSGVVRVPSGVTVMAGRNAANSADLALVILDASNNTIYGAQSGSAKGILRGTTGVDLDVAGTVRAAISSSGLSVTGAITASDVLSTGGIASSAGQIRMPNATGIFARNAANNANYSLLASDASNNITVGASSGTAVTTVLGTTGARLNVAGTDRVSATTTGATVTGAFSATTTVTGTTALIAGSNAASVGSVRLPNNTSIQWRNAANTGDVIALAVGAGDDVTIGGGAAAVAYVVSSGSVHLYSGATRIEVNGTGIGFNASAPVAKGTITGAKGGNAALASLLTYLASRGDITDSTTA